MDIGITLAEEELKKDLTEKVKNYVATAIDRFTNSYDTEKLIRETIAAQGDSIIISLIKEELANSNALRERIREILERKIKAQLQKVMHEAEKE